MEALNNFYFQGGALAGISVDVALYPLDTLKTRLQSQQGFQKAGGFKGVYRGKFTVGYFIIIFYLKVIT